MHREKQKFCRKKPSDPPKNSSRKAEFQNFQCSAFPDPITWESENAHETRICVTRIKKLRLQTRETDPIPTTSEQRLEDTRSAMSSTAGTTAELIRLQTSLACEFPDNEPKSTYQTSLALEARKRCTDMAVSQDACSKGGTDDSKYAANPPTYSEKGPEMYYLSGLRGACSGNVLNANFASCPRNSKRTWSQARKALHTSRRRVYHLCPVRGLFMATARTTVCSACVGPKDTQKTFRARKSFQNLTWTLTSTSSSLKHFQNRVQTC